MSDTTGPCLLGEFQAYTDHKYYSLAIDRIRTHSNWRKLEDRQLTHEWLARQYFNTMYDLAVDRPDVRALSGQPYHAVGAAFWVHERAEGVIRARLLHAARRLP